MTNKDTTTWFSSWFDTPYYHILYKERNDSEAHVFMNNLINYLNIPEEGVVLDLACGKGRHARYLNKIGFDVVGVDLSENSIEFAKQFENHKLRFDVHDMSKPYKKNHFDAVFNLFTSFGYFENDDDNLNTIKAIKDNLSELGFGVIDFLNTNFVIDNLVPNEIKTVEGIDFNLKRFVEDGYIIKDISFQVESKLYHFQERVRAFTLHDFQDLFKKANIHLLDVFGDYHLNKFNAKTSERLIMIFK